MSLDRYRWWTVGAWKYGYGYIAKLGPMSAAVYLFDSVTFVEVYAANAVWFRLWPRLQWGHR